MHSMAATFTIRLCSSDTAVLLAVLIVYCPLAQPRKQPNCSRCNRGMQNVLGVCCHFKPATHAAEQAVTAAAVRGLQ